MANRCQNWAKLVEVVNCQKKNKPKMAITPPLAMYCTPVVPSSPCLTTPPPPVGQTLADRFSGRPGRRQVLVAIAQGGGIAIRYPPNRRHPPPLSQLQSDVARLTALQPQPAGLGNGHPHAQDTEPGDMEWKELSRVEGWGTCVSTLS